MAKYIDADYLLNLIADPDEPERYGYLSASDIHDAPAADVRPERHGVWVNESYVAETIDGKNARVRDPVHYRCSNCGGKARIMDNSCFPMLYPFCPHCGAMMDRKDEN